MKRSEKFAARTKLFWASTVLVVLIALVPITGLIAQSGQSGGYANLEGPPTHAATSAVIPNYELASRFMPAKIGKLVFSTSVAPHWFELSDRFWYTYQTSDGAHYWVVDPVKKTRTPLWDNAKVAAALSTLTNFAYDAQHLPVRNLKLVNKDTIVRFEVQVSKDAVIPDEVKKEVKDEEQDQQEPPDADQSDPQEKQQDKQQDKQVDKQQQDKQQGDKQQDKGQQQQRGQRGQRGGAAGAQTPPAPTTRTIYFEYDLATAKVKRVDGFEAPLRKPTWAQISPDEKTILFARGHNLYMMDAANYAKAQKKPDDATIVETQLTTDGVEKYSYARPLQPEQVDRLKTDNKGDAKHKAGMRTPATQIHWSKDSKKFALDRDDNRKVADLWVIHTLATPRPVLESYSYAMPGEENVPIEEIQVFDLATRKALVIQPKNFVQEQISILDSPVTNRERELARDERDMGEGDRQGMMMPSGPARKWLADTSDKLYFMSMSRDYKKVDICVADTTTGTVKKLIQERSNVWLDTKPLRSVNNGQELIWWSQRDGWGHYYLYDSEGKLKNQITSGEYMAEDISAVNDKLRVLYFTAAGHEPNEDPYYDHLYRVNFDGTGLKNLTPGDFTHAINAADSGKYFVDNFSRVDAAPRSVLVDEFGAPVADLETTDVKRLLDAGFKYPEVFKVKADDGITDLYGVIYKPFDFDPTRKYPVIEYVYPGPQTESVTKGFATRSPNIALAQFGFIVIEVGNRGGSPQRNKWYDSYGYGNLRDYGLADKKAAAEQLALTRPYIDLTRVGIWGHSGGGFMTAAALLQYPDFFKAGWSESGNHDNNVYNKYWSEKYHGVKEQAEKDGTTKFLYDIDKNSDLAKNLKGHLMLTTGDMDDNVHMANTMRLANALIRANKRFDMMVYPGMRHGYTGIGDYVIIRRGDFFSHCFLGWDAHPADILELQRERLAAPGRRPGATAATQPDYDDLDPDQY